MSHKQRLIFVIITLLFSVFPFSIARANSGDQERVDVILNLIQKNVSRAITSKTPEGRLSEWKYNVQVTRENLDELLKEVAKFRDAGQKANIPAQSYFYSMLEERKKNFLILTEYRKTLENLIAGIDRGKYADKKSLLSHIDRRFDRIERLIDEKEPLIILDQFDISAELKNLRDNLQSSDFSRSRAIINNALMASNAIFNEYTKTIDDLNDLQDEYQKILQFNDGNISQQDFQPASKKGEIIYNPINFSVQWGDSPFAWRDLQVGDVINPRITNISGGTGNYTYSWVMNGKLISNQAYASHRFETPGMHYLVVNVSDSQNVNQWQSYVYNVKAGARFDFDYSVSNENPSPGDTINLNVYNIRGGGPPYRYRWEMNGRNFSTSQSASYRFRDTGTYNLRIEVRDNYGNVKVKQRTFRIGVSSQITFDLWSSDKTPRVGQTVRFRIQQVSGGKAPYRFYWRMSDGASGEGDQFNYRFNRSGHYRLTIIVSDSVGRQSSKYFDYNVGGSSGALKAEIYYSNDRPRIGETIVLEARNVTGGVPPYRYRWLENNEQFSEDLNARRSWDRAGSYRITLVVTDSENSRFSTHHIINVSMAPTEQLSFREWIQDASPKLGQNVQMRIEEVKGGVPPYSYKWEMNGTVFSNSPNANYTFNTPGSQILKITVSDRTGQSQVRSRQFIVQGAQTPLSFDLRVSDPTPKSGQTVQFIAENIRGGVSPYTISWTMNGIQIGTGHFISYRFHQGNYTLQATLRDAVGSTATRTQNFNVQGESGSMPITFVLNASNLRPRINEMVTFSVVSIQGGVPPYRVSWMMNGVNIGNQNSVSQVFRGPGVFTVQAVVTDSTGRTKTEQARVIVSPRHK